MRRWVKWFGLLLLLAVSAVILINQFDEPPDPAAVAASTPRSPRVADGQNGYLRLLALGADDGADGMAYAKVWLDEARAAAREHRVARKATAKRAERPELCDPARVSCLSVVRDKPEEHAQSLQAWREDIARYESLLASTAYEEVLDYPQRLESRLPDYAKAGTAQRAWLLRAALAVHEARVEEALGAVERDIAFQRVMLAGTRTLIGRMVAAANYNRSLAFLTDLLQTSVLDMKPLAPRVAAMLESLPPAALSFDELMATEFAALRHALSQGVAAHEQSAQGVLQGFGRRSFYKEQKTANRVYRQYVETAKHLNRPASQVRAVASQPLARAEMTVWDYIDNPVGNILMRVATPSFGGYALRLHDLEARIRLLALASQIVANDVTGDPVADFVAKSDARYHDPYTGKPMAWDAAKQRLSFNQGRMDNTREAFNVEQGVVFVML